MHGSKSTNRAYATDLKAMRMRITRGGIRTAKRNPTRSAGIALSARTPRERVVGGSSSFWPAMGSSAPAAAVDGGEAMEGAEDRRLLRCVNCGRGMQSLFVQYSPGNIRLMKCEHCKAVADPYIECEFMIILIDLILHKRKAYRHLLFNMLNLGVGGKGIIWKSTLVYFVLDVLESLTTEGRFSLLTSNKACLDSSGSLLVSTLTCGKVLVDVLLGKLIFISVLLLGTRFLLNLPFDMIRYRHIVLAVIISSYFRLFLIAMMVWEFPSSVLLIVDILVLSSNALALEVITELPTAGCVAACFSAHASTFFVNHWLPHLLSS